MPPLHLPSVAAFIFLQLLSLPNASSLTNQKLAHTSRDTMSHSPSSPISPSYSSGSVLQRVPARSTSNATRSRVPPS